MRALLPVCTLDYEIYNLKIINNDKKTILRLVIEEHDLFNNRGTLQPIKGYDKASEHVIEALTTKLGLMPTNKPLLLTLKNLTGLLSARVIKEASALYLLVNKGA